LAEAMKFAQQTRRAINQAGHIGLAWITTDKGIVWHNGGTGGYKSFLGFRAGMRRGVVILSNTAMDADDLGFAALDADAPLAPAYKAIVLSNEQLNEYVGAYKLGDKFLLKVFRQNGELFAQATGQSAVPIFPFAPNEFFAKVAGISISFKRDANGLVDGLVLHQNGDRTAPKLNASELPPEPKEIALDAAVLNDYAGKYQFSFGMFDVMLMNGRLEAQLTGQPAAPIFASAKDKFFYKIVDAQLDFERDAEGKVVAVILRQNGRNMRAPRMTSGQ
jgi:D-alanyl-D-alanine-carboxypeptidase/D-alanyl-D-alanine-endopeptidase